MTEQATTTQPTGTATDVETPTTDEQMEQISELMDGLDGEPPETAPAEREPDDGRPEPAQADDGARKETGTDGDRAQKETQPPTDPQAQPKPEAGKQEDTPPDPLETAYEVKTADGVRQVAARDLVTTYQQYADLQRRHVALKPVIELARQAKVPMEKVYPFLALGIRTAMQQRTGQPEGAKAAGSEPPAGGYQGPFASAEEDARVKEADPTFHASMWNQHRMLSEMRDHFQTLQSGFQEFRNQDRQTRTSEQMDTLRQDLEKRITDFAGTHTDYFKPDEATGKSERMDLFRQFLGTRYGHLDISDLTPEVLGAAFAVFDPAYYQGYMASQARAKEQQLREQDRKAFAETDNVSTSTPSVQRNEQEQAMDEVLGL